MNMSICQECSVEDQETSAKQEAKYKATLPPPRKRKQHVSNHVCELIRHGLCENQKRKVYMYAYVCIYIYTLIRNI